MKNAVPLILIAFLLWYGITQRTDPGPVPDPTPVVVVDPPLIDADGLYVLIMEEKDDRQNLPARQQSVLVPSSQLTGWLNDHQGQWRIFDQNDQDVGHDDAKWQKAKADVKFESVPWLYIQVAGKRKFSGPLPGTVADTIATLEKAVDAGGDN